MSLSSRLRYEKTLRVNKASTTFNAPGTYPTPYGRGLIKISGRGASGNPTTGGNVANYNAAVPGNVVSYNPSTPGNYAGSNPASGGNIANYNPVVPGNAYYVPGNLVPDAYTPGNANPAVYTPGNYVEGTYKEQVQGQTTTCPTGWATNYDYDEKGHPYKICVLETFPYNNPGTYTPGYTNPGTYTPAYYNPATPATNPSSGGTANYNPYVPAAPYYNPATPGNANYNPSTPGNANYNPVVPGNAGAPAVLHGVTFPGGGVGVSAPTVPPTPSNMSYSANGVPISVPPGGSITITPI